MCHLAAFLSHGFYFCRAVLQVKTKFKLRHNQENRGWKIVFFNDCPGPPSFSWFPSVKSALNLLPLAIVSLAGV
jgi:hypothetical protein